MSISYVINSIANPVAALNDLYNTSKNQRLFGNFELDYKFHFLPELRWVTNVGYDKDWGYGSRIRDARTRTGEREGQFIGENTFSDGQSVNTLLDSYFNYSNSKNENFKYDATLGYSYQKFTGDEFTTGNINIPTNITNPRFFRDDLVYIGFFGRVNFTVKDKYLLTMSLRRDGTSRFSEDNRWGYFPAASVAWKLKNELFKDSNIVTDLKLRAGWGVNGQQDIGGIGRSNLIYLSQYLQGTDTSSYVFGGQFINPAFPQGFNPEITWEKTATYNTGLDFGLFNSRLSGSIDAFMKKSTDLLQRAPFADGTNFTNNGPQNVGEMTTKGIELTINYEVIKSENMNWNVNFNATTFERRIDKLASEIVQTGESVGSFGQAQAHVEGYAPNSFWVFKQLYDSTGNPLQGSFADINGDGNYDAKDRYLYRNPDPKLILGFTSNFNYKNLDFSFNLRSNIGNRVLNTISALNSNYARIYDVTPTNLNLSVYNTNFANNVENQAFSDMFVENASFLRMDWATIGYTFPKWLEGKASLRIFTSVQNPFIITNYSGLDPEIVNGIDRGIFPRQRQFLLGCNVKF
jgi:TonB-linked SusC/RagA family outer membrane protein